MALDEAGLRLVGSLSCSGVDVGIRCRFHDVYMVWSMCMGYVCGVLRGEVYWGMYRGHFR